MSSPTDAAVTVRLFAAARAAAGTSQTLARPGSLRDVTAELTERFSGLAPVLPICSFLVDGLHAEPGDPVANGATLDVMPPFAGG